MKTKEQAIANLLLIVPHLRYAAKKALANGKLQLAILSVQLDGSGQLECRFDANDFVEDLACAIDAPDYTSEDELNVKAEELLQKYGIK